MNGLVSQIERLTAKINKVDDSAVGGLAINTIGTAPILGQLGCRFVLDMDSVKYDSTVGTVYGGIFQYVQTKAASTAAPARGSFAFWSTAVADDLYRVTPDEDDAMGANNCAGVYIGAPTKGQYCVIQIGGRAFVKYRAGLTGAAAVGEAVYCAGAGAGADVGLADVLNGAGNPTFTQVGNMLARFIGVARELPVAGATTTVDMPWPRIGRI